MKIEYGLSQQQNKNQSTTKSKRQFKGIEYWMRKTAEKGKKKMNKREEHELAKKEECMNMKIFMYSFCKLSNFSHESMISEEPLKT